MSSFFISYSHKDLAYAEKIRKHLQLVDSSHNVFLDIYKLKTGIKWKEHLLMSIRNNDFFILILSSNSASSTFVQQEVKWVRQDERKKGIRKLFVIRIDEVPIPPYLEAFQVLNTTGNFAIDFYKLMDGLNSKASYYQIRHERSSDSRSGYKATLFVDAPAEYLKKIEMVEYRFDYEFEGNEDVDVVELLENTRSNVNKKFAVKFWFSEPVLVFVVIYLKSLQQITFEHRVPLYF